MPNLLSIKFENFNALTFFKKFQKFIQNNTTQDFRKFQFENFIAHRLHSYKVILNIIFKAGVSNSNCWEGLISKKKAAKATV
jgi:hypothetical protein